MLSIEIVGGNSMKLFQFNQKLCQTLGIGGHEINQNRCTFEWKNAIFAFYSTQLAVLITAFLLYDASTMDEYGVGFVTVICVTQSTVYYFSLLWKQNEILKFIGNCERFIGMSMF